MTRVDPSTEPGAEATKTAEPEVLSLLDEVALAEAEKKIFGAVENTSVALSLGRFEFVGVLGQGGMGVVYEVYDPSLARRLALKRPRGDASRPRFHREAKALARLSHPNVVQVHDVIEGAEPAIVMELLDGETLAEWLNSKPRTWREILEGFLQAGEGLAAIHRVGLVHRDFKPSNVMVTREGRVVVMDLGLVHEGASPGSSSGGIAVEPSETGSGPIAGTRAYMAPEQLAGGRADPAGDQYSFCISLRAALCAELSPVREATTKGPSNAVPRWILDVLRRGTAARPSERWPSMGVVLEELRDDPSQRRRRKFIAVALLGASSLSALAYSGYAEFEDRRARAACRDQSRTLAAHWTPESRARLSAAFSSTGSPMAPIVWPSVESLAGAYIERWTEVRQAACLDASLGASGDEPLSEREVDCLELGATGFLALFEAWEEADAAFLPRAAQALAGLEDPARCREQTAFEWKTPSRVRARQGVLELRKEIASLRTRMKLGAEVGLQARAEDLVVRARDLDWGPILVEAELNLARVLRDVGEYESAYAAGKRAYTAAVASGHDSEALYAAKVVADLAQARADLDAALQWRDVANAMLDRLGLRGTIHEAEVASTSGTIERKQGRLESSLREHLRALEVHAAHLGDDHYLVTVDRLNAANALAALERHAEARAYLETVAEHRSRMFGAQHPSLYFVHTNLATVLAELGQPESSAQSFARALELGEASFGPHHPRLLPLLSNMAASSYADDEFGRARELYARMEALARRVHGDEHPTVGVAWVGLGNVALATGRAGEAAESFRAGIEPLEAGWGPSHPSVATARKGLARAYLASGDALAARTELERALEIASASQGAQALTAGIRHRLARALWQLGEAGAAVSMGRRALEYFQSEAAVGLEDERDELAAWLATTTAP